MLPADLRATVHGFPSRAERMGTFLGLFLVMTMGPFDAAAEPASTSVPDASTDQPQVTLDAVVDEAEPAVEIIIPMVRPESVHCTAHGGISPPDGLTIGGPEDNTDREPYAGWMHECGFIIMAGDKEAPEP